MNLPKKRDKNLSGQALILVLLGMAVVLTLVLSIVSSSITDIDISSRDEEATRALSAAEAGVEQSFLLADDSSGTFDENNSSFDAVVSGIAQGSNEYNFPRPVPAGEASILWYVSHDGTDLRCEDPDFPCVNNPDTSLQVCFGEKGTTDIPAVEVSVFYDPTGQGVSGGDFSNVLVTRAVYDPDSVRALTNGFAGASDTDCSVGSETYEYSAPTFNMSSLGVSCANPTGCLLFAKAKPIYNDISQPIGFISGELLPAQGIQVESTGISGESTRKLEVFRSYKNVPPVFDSAVFSQVNLVK